MLGHNFIKPYGIKPTNQLTTLDKDKCLNSNRNNCLVITYVLVKHSVWVVGTLIINIV